MRERKQHAARRTQHAARRTPHSGGDDGVGRRRQEAEQESTIDIDIEIEIDMSIVGRWERPRRCVRGRWANGKEGSEWVGGW